MGGRRVEAFHRFHRVGEGECIKFYDVTSLYPFVQKSNHFPINKIYNLIDEEVPTVDEFIQMMKDNPNSGAALIAIQAPEQLLHPVLGCKIKGKFVFTLCPKCAEFDLFPFTHDEDERMIVGEYTYPEIELALEMGYRLVRLYEVVFCKETAPIFEKCVNDIIGLKVAYSGWPDNIKTDEQKIAYVDSYRRQGINVKVEDIQPDNSGVFPFKTAANALWGYLAMNSDKFKSIGLVKSSEELIALLEGRGKHKIEYVLNSITSDTIMYTYSSEDKKRGVQSNLLISSYVTSLARIYLYRAIQWAGPDLIYCDTDSILVKQKINSPAFPGLGPLLGQWKDEIGEGKTIVESAALSPKCYGLKITTPENNEEYRVKIKGNTLDPNDAKASYEKIKTTVFEENSEIPFASRQFKIQQGGGAISLRHTVKLLKDN